MKKFGNLPFLREPPIHNFFMTPFFVQISKTRTPTLILGSGGRKLWCCMFLWEVFSSRLLNTILITLHMYFAINCWMLLTWMTFWFFHCNIKGIYLLSILSMFLCRFKATASWNVVQCYFLVLMWVCSAW